MTAYVVSDCEHGRVFGCRVSVSSHTESYLLCSQPGAMEQPGTYCIPPHQLAGMTSILTPAFKRQWSDPLQVGSTGPLTHEHQTLPSSLTGQADHQPPAWGWSTSNTPDSLPFQHKGFVVTAPRPLLEGPR